MKNDQNTKLISVLIPTRKRLSRLQRCIKSFEENTKNYSKIELIFKIDVDDNETFNFLINYNHKIDTKYIFSDRLNGYGNLHDFYNEMAKISSGYFLYIFNDDIYMKTFGWEEIIEKYKNKFCILAHNTYLLDNSPAVINQTNRNKIFTENFNGNPIFPKKIFELWGFISLNPMVDFWISTVVKILKQKNFNIEEWIEIKCECDRPDGTYGSAELDSTFLEGRQYLTWDLNTKQINNCVNKVINHLDSIKNKFKVITKNPIAINSNDHLYPEGTKNDNFSNLELITELENFFGRKFSAIDLGCAGGKFVKDLNDSGNLAIGLEGSNYSILHQRAEWPLLYNKNLFTCDISKPFTIKYNDALFRADVISAWEVLEHIDLEDLPTLFSNIKAHLNTNGIFIATVAQFYNCVNNIHLHKSVFSKEKWINEIFSDFNIFEYPFKNCVRDIDGSFKVLLKL